MRTIHAGPAVPVGRVRRVRSVPIRLEGGLVFAILINAARVVCKSAQVITRENAARMKRGSRGGERKV